MDGTTTEIVRAIGTAGLLVPALIVVVRALKEQYEKRIESLESRSEQCEKDRSELHKRIEDVWREIAGKRREDKKEG